MVLLVGVGGSTRRAHQARGHQRRRAGRQAARSGERPTPGHRKAHEFKDVEVTDAQKAELKALTGKTSVPQVFVKGQFIGGCNDGGLGGTVPLLKSGKLQEMLK